MSSNNTFICKDSICVVTGAASGIGKALCLRLASLGAKKIIAVDINFNNTATTLIHEINNTSSNSSDSNNVCHVINANCGIESDMRRVIMTVEYQHGPIDAFFCNAGILSVGSVTDTPNDEWQKLWNINVMQIVYVSKYLIPIYEQRKERKNKGSLIITASAAGLLTLPGASSYSVTKNAAVSLAEWLSITYGGLKGIHVSCLCPQAVQTPMIGDTDGGPAGLDGVMDASDVAKITIDEVQKGVFMITPHQKVRKYLKAKGNDYEQWIRHMRKLNTIVEQKYKITPPSLPNSKL
jgi:NAD(P)-dependent dehydrogenase (short-subunit alcohol dehydrogenase family)